MSLSKIGSIGINTGIQFAGVTTTVTLKVGTGVTLSSDGDIFTTGVTTCSTIDGLTASGGVTIAGVATFTNSDTVIQPSLNTGSLKVRSLNGTNVFQVASETGNSAVLGTVQVVKDVTLGSNLNASGIITAASFVGDGSALTGIANTGVIFTDKISLGDNGRISVGLSSDLSVYHDGNHTRVVDSGTGDLKVQTNALQLLNVAGNEYQMLATAGGSVDLFYNASRVFQTTSSGIEVTAQSAGSVGQISIIGRDSGGNADAISRIKSYPDAATDKSDLAIETRNSSGQYIERIRFSNDNRIILGSVSNQSKIVTNTDDGSDNVVLSLGGGGNALATRGATLNLYGNELSNGKADLYTGDSGSSFSVYTGGSKSFEVKSDGDIEIGDGNLKFGTSGKGISFSETSDASGKTSELFDDYEEGTWTPNLVGLSNTPAFAAQQGKYTKVGRLVNLAGLLQGGGTKPLFTSQTDILKISGVPFAPNGSGYRHAYGTVTWQNTDWYGTNHNAYNYNQGQIAVGMSGSNLSFWISRATHDSSGALISYATNKTFHNKDFLVEFNITYMTDA